MTLTRSTTASFRTPRGTGGGPPTVGRHLECEQTCGRLENPTPEMWFFPSAPGGVPPHLSPPPPPPPWPPHVFFLLPFLFWFGFPSLLWVAVPTPLMAPLPFIFGRLARAIHTSFTLLDSHRPACSLFSFSCLVFPFYSKNTSAFSATLAAPPPPRASRFSFSPSLNTNIRPRLRAYFFRRTTPSNAPPFSRLSLSHTPSFPFIRP
jgi:hypothetical protein